MKPIFILSKLLFLLWFNAALAQFNEPIIIGKNAFAFHAEAFSNFKQLELQQPIPTDSVIFVDIIGGTFNYMKINKLNLVVARARQKIHNAGAFIFENCQLNGRKYSECRILVLDPSWAQSNAIAFYRTLAHESGHLFCGHTEKGYMRDPWEAELEADRFAGAFIRRLEQLRKDHLLEKILESASKVYSTSPTRSHPPRSQRLDAIRLGYLRGSDCGDLAPLGEAQMRITRTISPWLRLEITE